MKGMGTARKWAVAVAVCMAVVCLPGYSEPTPEQVKERTNLLIEAVDDNNVERAKLCIKLGADVNARLYYFLNGQYKYLTTNRNEIHNSDVETYTLLTYALRFDKNKDIVELLIKAGADVNAKTNEGTTVLQQVASRKGWKDITELLIKTGADVNAAADSGWTALMSAAAAESKDTVEALIKAGADVNAKTNDGYTALMCATNKDTAKLLIKSGANMNVKGDGGMTVLICAAENGRKEVVELLIKLGTDINAKTNNGWTALMCAVSRYTHATFETGSKDNNYKDVAELLIKAGADSNATLIWAVKNFPDTYAVELLIKLGVNPNATDSEGISALDYAILYNHDREADLLRAAGATE